MKKIKTSLSNKQFIVLIGILILLTNTITMYLTFLAAFLNSNSILITINTFGEAWLEFFLLPITIILGLYVVFYFYKTLPIKGEVKKL